MNYVIQGTHRAYWGSDTALEAWVRTDDGKRDLDGLDLVVEIRERPSRKALLTIPATSSELGKLDFTVDAEGARKRLWPGVFALSAKADNEVIYTAILEIV